MKDFSSLWNQARAAGVEAGMAVRPAPMVVFEADLSGRPIEGGQRWHEPEGVCGFAWVVVKPGNCEFARWAKANKRARAEYGGGMCVEWVSDFNQSMDRKEAYARAFSKVLSEAGINASPRSRMD